MIPVPPWNFSSKVRMLPNSLMVMEGCNARIWPCLPTRPTVTSIHLESPAINSSSPSLLHHQPF